MSRKSERLVNLVIALLATKRSLTKSEIFRTIEGYEGSNESMERMFERDKDELRALGINIEVSGLDPLFDDEVGYKIRPEDFSMDTKGFSTTEIAYMSLAVQVWKDVSLDEVSQKALRKLSGLSIPIDVSEVPAVAPLVLSAPKYLSEVIGGIAERRSATFSYFDANLDLNIRKVNIYSYFSHKGFWYFSGFDLDKSDIRTFRCDRVAGEIELSSKSGTYEVPNNFNGHASFTESETQQRLVLNVRKGRCSQLRILAVSSVSLEDFDQIEIEYVIEEEIIALVLWHLDDVEIVSPDYMREKIVASLKDLIKNHG